MFAVEEIANWFLAVNAVQRRTDEFVEPISQMKLHKLLYYAQGVFLAYTDSELFDEDILAWKHGPVIRSIHDKYKGVRDIKEELSDSQIDDYKKVASCEIASNVLSAVEKVYGNVSAWDLRNQTHEERPWKNNYKGDGTSEIIPKIEIKEFFKEEIVSG